MGQALAKLELELSKHSKNVASIPSKHSFLHSNNIENDNNNDDDYINILEKKRNAIKEYLVRNIDLRNIDRNYENSKSKVVNMDKLLDIKEAMEYCGIKSDKTIRNWIKAGMPHIEVPGKTYPKKMVSTKDLDIWKHGKPENVVNAKLENSETVDNSTTQENRAVEIIEPEKYLPEPQNNFVTRDELNSYTLTIKDFTESINLLRQDNQELRYRLEQMELRQKEIDIENRTSRIEKYISEMRDRQRLPWWRKLFIL